MKVVIPVAGVGSRLKPHTHTTPKPLMDVAGKPMLDYVIAEVSKMRPSEMIFVVGHMRSSITKYLDKKYPKMKKRYVHQEVADGDGSAVRLALQGIEKDEELLVVFGDTLIDFDLRKSLRGASKLDALIYAMEVDQPQNYGVMNTNKNLEVTSVEEKPKKPKSNLAIIGAYYFKSLFDVRNELDYAKKHKQTDKGEYRLVHVVKKYSKAKDKVIKASKVKKWFDCGRVETLLEANRYFLSKHSKGKTKIQGTCIMVPPCYISKTAKVENSIIGPNASIGDGAIIEHSIIRNSIVNHEAVVEKSILKESLIGKQVYVKGKSQIINIGEKSTLILD